MKIYGLIGYPLSHSFSKGFFAKKFEAENITDCLYDNFPIPAITEFPTLLHQQPHLNGLNVTIPYKEVIIPYLDGLNDAAARIGAVNCIRFEGGKKIGYNTDVIGFSNSIRPLILPHHTHALVLGTGGAAKAVMYALQEMNIAYTLVSRQATAEAIAYDALDQAVIEKHTVIINTTPLGMYPQVDAAPDIPYQYLTSRHLLYDLVYNPAVTLFLQRGVAQGAITKNGHDMLILQAEASWEIWNG
ncbi:shikimate dehydrogenase family protein [Chitinophaga nivalis]|uniref:Shikimate dehydrogenase n=1 Tax=Chitinophaga nivalis TaxID=2991709 RepID=A0ABT3IF45_9BACT|nr:shikimate dehydrogenase [Chitinophaga nivalis]MCW3467720.1 shikimate dehydrogenase [Chitinophaga nivalis]MCW3482588.1 shikimate dehydrogenase [Chitinophaga nivalis]